MITFVDAFLIVRNVKLWKFNLVKGFMVVVVTFVGLVQKLIFVIFAFIVAATTSI